MKCVFWFKLESNVFITNTFTKRAATSIYDNSFISEYWVILQLMISSSETTNGHSLSV